MKEVTHDWLCLIYTLICDDVEINVGQVIFFTMKKVHYIEGCSYGFGGLLTQFFRRHQVGEEELDYIPVADSALLMSPYLGAQLGSKAQFLLLQSIKLELMKSLGECIAYKCCSCGLGEEKL